MTTDAETGRNKQLRFLEFLGTVGGLFGIAVSLRGAADPAYVLLFTLLLFGFFISIVYSFSRILFGGGKPVLHHWAKEGISSTLSGLVMLSLYETAVTGMKSQDPLVYGLAAVFLGLTFLLMWPLAKLFDQPLRSQ